MTPDSGLRTPDSPDVAIIGGGVIGCACAWVLAKAGMSVSLYERGRIGSEASGASAGILAPLAESSSPGPFSELAIAGLHAFADHIEAITEEGGIDPEYRRCGVIRLALDPRDAESLRESARWQANQSLGLRWVDADEVGRLEPALAPSHGALLSEDEGQVRPALLVRALASAAARHGARIHEFAEIAGPSLTGDRATGVRLTNGVTKPAGSVLLTGGAWSGLLAAGAGAAIPVRPVKGQYATLSMLPRPLRHVVFAGHGYLVPRVDGTIYAGATEEDAGYDRRVTAEGVGDVLTMARAILPALRDAEVMGMGAGLRPGSADGLPALGRIPGVADLFVAAGHYRNGILMSLITATLMTDLVLGREPSLPLAAFAPSRFSPNAERGMQNAE